MLGGNCRYWLCCSSWTSSAGAKQQLPRPSRHKEGEPVWGFFFCVLFLLLNGKQTCRNASLFWYQRKINKANQEEKIYPVKPCRAAKPYKCKLTDKEDKISRGWVCSNPNNPVLCTDKVYITPRSGRVASWDLSVLCKQHHSNLPFRAHGNPKPILSCRTDNWIKEI